MTDDERGALVERIATKVAGEVCPGSTPPCVEDDYHRESCGCMDVATAILAAIETAIRAAALEEAARVEASERRRAHAEVERLRAAVQKAQRPEGETIDGVVSWIKEDAERLATVRAALAEDTP